MIFFKPDKRSENKIFIFDIHRKNLTRQGFVCPVFSNFSSNHEILAKNHVKLGGESARNKIRIGTHPNKKRGCFNNETASLNKY